MILMDAQHRYPTTTMRTCNPYGCWKERVKSREYLSVVLKSRPDGVVVPLKELYSFKRLVMRLLLLLVGLFAFLILWE